ncbi:right-handed parallel beta-helix repeat-containing protein [Cerasicoccus arenae]|uniref:Right handed beta helix domain-containing protein n=1 Tax=Cerasicoccus arenae TaxID=424488 RepID=A0A8J3DAV8_9BACT|nr:right-handed parallel beta-helix repeat-containing protein [Cerasicoccus arenae]MBK1859707.1 right-handed parallel beta-helix repeat-containing protein [Cerasicoccus arenae]GHC03709.1 hypothetical protein GCM10007047_20440 [Cerasicoccus arenae]
MEASEHIAPPLLDKVAETNYIDLSEYTHPGDPDSAHGIRQAISESKRSGIRRIQFEPGRYYLKSHITHVTDGIIHDAGSKGSEPIKECHILIDDVHDMALCGAMNAAGQPSTVLVGWNDQKNHGFLPAILWCENSPGLQLENLAFTREPAYSASGLVTDKTTEKVTVEILPECIAWDGMGAYCSNRLISNGETLIGESITYGHGAGSSWKSIGNNRFQITNTRMVEMLSRGELLSWHQGAQTDFQIYIGHCDNLQLKNLRTYNSNGFCLLTESCRNITAKSVKFWPDGDRLFTGPRDAWKIFKCGGQIQVDGLEVKGVRMDGQNMHSNWLYLHHHINQTEAIFFCKYTYAPILPDTLIEFYNGPIHQTCVVENSSLEGKVEIGHGGHLYRIRFKEKLPSFAQESCLCSVRCWEADQYVCINSDFINIAGAGHLARYDNLQLRNNRYRNTMNPGILLGAEMPTHAEGGHATNIRIEQCDFDNCGFFPRYNTRGCIGVHSAGFELPLNHDIEITKNTFRNSDIGIDVMTARDVRISDNRYENIKQRIRIDASTTNSITVNDT